MNTSLKISLIISLAFHAAVLLFLPVNKKQKVLYISFPVDFISPPPAQSGMQVDSKENPPAAVVEEEKTKDTVAVEKVVKKEKNKGRDKGKKEIKKDIKTALKSETPKPGEKEGSAAGSEEGIHGRSISSLSYEGAAKFPYSYFINQMRRRISDNWAYSKNVGGLRTVVYFRIMKDGSIENVKVSETSGNNYYDQMAMRSVTLSDPFPPLPAGFSDEYLGVFFEFKYSE